MKIAILEYTTQNVHIVDAPDSLEDSPAIERWIEENLEMRTGDIAYMADVNKVYDYGNIIEKILRS